MAGFEPIGAVIQNPSSLEASALVGRQARRPQHWDAPRTPAAVPANGTPELLEVDSSGLDPGNCQSESEASPESNKPDKRAKSIRRTRLARTLRSIFSRRRITLQASPFEGLGFVHLAQQREDNDPVFIYKLTKNGINKSFHLEQRDDFDSVNDETKLAPLGVAVLRGHENPVRYLLERGANINGVPGSRPPLWVAAVKTPKNAALDMLNILLNDPIDNPEAKPDQRSSVDDYTTPLLRAVNDHRNLDLVRALVEAGADPNAPNPDGTTPMRIAVGCKDYARLNAMQPIRGCGTVTVAVTSRQPLA